VDGEAQIYVRILKKVRCLKRDGCHMVVQASSYHKTICRDGAGNTLCSSNECHCLFRQTVMCMEGIAVQRFMCCDCSQIAHTIKPSFRLAEAAVSGPILSEPYKTMETAPFTVTKHVGFANLTHDSARDEILLARQPKARMLYRASNMLRQIKKTMMTPTSQKSISQLPRCFVHP